MGDDIRDRVWFYFSVSGVTKYKSVLLVLKNGNSYKKFAREKKYKPYMVIKEGEEWKPIYATKFNVLLG